MPAPFVGETFRFSNPDGTVVDVVGWGNQFHAVFETPDGYTVVENQAGFFEYAVASPDGTALIPSGTRVGVADPRALGLAPHVRAAGRPDDQSRGATVRERVPNRWEQRREERRTADAGLVSQATLSASAPVGDILGLCVLVDFPDVPATLTRQQVDDFCNLAGYNGFQNNGSVFDYYNDVSGGELRYRNVVTEYYTARHNRSYYTDEGRDFGSRAKLLAVEALDHLKFIKFNFDQLSTDGLYVYALNVFYAGEVVNKFRKGLWPHQSHLDSPYDITPNVPPPLPGVPPPTPQRVIFDYQISNTGSELTLFTFCHENGHMVCGFPDLYDTDVDAQGVAESLGVGDYSLMAYGGTGRTTAAKKNPVQIDGYLKHAAGWSARVGHLGNGDVATINAGLNDFLIHRKNESEYFLLENRRRTRTDTKGVTVDTRDKLLPDEGLLIWHVDKHGDNRRQQMTAESHYELSLEQADGRFDLERTHNNYGDGLDLYGAPASTFGQTTVPDSNWWDGTRSNLDIAKIDAPAPTMTITTKGLLGLAIARFGADEGWNVDKHPRLLARLASHAGGNVADILGFADDGVWISLNNGDGTFAPAQQVSTGFGSETGGWRVDRHPRMTADLTGDGAADIVGFADDGVWTCLNNGHGTFGQPKLAIADFGYQQEWRVEKHLRFVADIGFGRADLVGFGDHGVLTYANQGDGTFGGDVVLAVANFGYVAGGWRIDKHPRFLANLATHADGRTYADIIGFHDAGVFVSLNRGDGTFTDPKPAVAGFGTLQGWRPDRHVRLVADLTGDGTGDIVGFFDDGVWVSLNNGDATFQTPKRVIDNYGSAAGGWRIARHPRMLADLTGDGCAEVVGFGNQGVWISINQGDGTF